MESWFVGSRISSRYNINLYNNIRRSCLIVLFPMNNQSLPLSFTCVKRFPRILTVMKDRPKWSPSKCHADWLKCWRAVIRLGVDNWACERFEYHSLSTLENWNDKTPAVCGLINNFQRCHAQFLTFAWILWTFRFNVMPWFQKRQNQHISPQRTWRKTWPDLCRSSVLIFVWLETITLIPKMIPLWCTICFNWFLSRSIHN